MKSDSCKISPPLDLVVRKTIRNFPLLHHIVNCLTLLWSVIRITQKNVSSSIKNPWTKVHLSQSNKKAIKKESYSAISPAKRSSFHKGETKSAQNILNMRDSTFLPTSVLHLLPAPRVVVYLKVLQLECPCQVLCRGKRVQIAALGYLQSERTYALGRSPEDLFLWRPQK